MDVEYFDRPSSAPDRRNRPRHSNRKRKIAYRVTAEDLRGRRRCGNPQHGTGSIAHRRASALHQRFSDREQVQRIAPAGQVGISGVGDINDLQLVIIPVGDNRPQEDHLAGAGGRHGCNWEWHSCQPARAGWAR